ncbi:MAG: RagB/SusD family nutrient uptake outer membrane protein [Bacteroidales bacterium]|nr:RagB/SusD family nutrient uptake outer membrane protein [Bacteroidales bacterium]
MKRNIIIILFPIIFFGCEKVLDKKELNAIDSEDIWKDENLANLYLNREYNVTLPGFDGTENTETSDECSGAGTGNMMYGELSNSAVLGNFGSITYGHIKELNLLIDDIDKGSLEEEVRNLIKGQAYFLRAWVYWNLVIYYGGVPIILHVQDPFDYESLLVKRNSARECVNQIISDLDQAIELLPAQWTESERGRITRGAAAALKGRVLLFYASPQFNPDNLQERWQTAYDANQVAREMCEEDGYELYDDFENIFIDEEETSEAIFITVYNEINKSHNYEDKVRPRSQSDAKDIVSNAPNWEFVKSFPMKDGKPINNHPDYDSIYYWKDRDPRFYATVAYNGCIWELNNEIKRRQWTYLANTQERPSVAEGFTSTGFYCRKNIDTQIANTDVKRTPTDWIEIRLAEVYLNLAECAAEIENIAEARDLLILIRQRAGIEVGDGSYGITATTSEEMVEAVMLERKIELAFENKRHWDLRRRNMYINDLNNTPKINGTKRHGIATLLDTAYIKSLDPGIIGDSIYAHFENVIADTIDFDTQYDDFFNTIYNIDLDEERVINYLQPKYNFYFIHVDDLEKNPNLQQTINWGGYNPFDPLAD